MASPETFGYTLVYCSFSEYKIRTIFVTEPSELQSALPIKRLPIPVQKLNTVLMCVVPLMVPILTSTGHKTNFVRPSVLKCMDFSNKISVWTYSVFNIPRVITDKLLQTVEILLNYTILCTYFRWYICFSALRITNMATMRIFWSYAWHIIGIAIPPKRLF
jgi:hypothetical protein